MIKILHNLIFRRKKSFIATTMLSFVSIVLIIFSLYVYMDSRYCLDNVKKLMSGSLENAGLYYAKEGYELETKYINMRKDVYNLPEVKSVGYIIKGGMVVQKGMEEIYDIQKKNNEYVDDEYAGMIEEVCISNTAIDICKLKLLEGEVECDVNQDENTMYLYLGYNFREIPVGTEYVIKYGEGADNEMTVTYIIKGIMEKGQKIVDGRFFTDTSDMLSEEAFFYMDNLILNVSNDDFLNFNIIILDENADYDEVDKNIHQLGKENGLLVATATLPSIIKARVNATREINKMITELLVMVLFVSMTIIICMQITAIFNNRSEYGIYLANGYSFHFLSLFMLIENVIKFVLATVLAVFISRKLIFEYAFSSRGYMEYTFNDIFNRYVMPCAIVSVVILIIVSTVIPVIVLKRQKPVEMIGGNET